MNIEKSVFKRVILEGHRAWQDRGPNRVCPYGRDPRNGAWSFGALKAKQGFSSQQAWELFCDMEYNRLPQMHPLLDEIKEPEIKHYDFDHPPELIPAKSRKYF